MNYTLPIVALMAILALTPAAAVAWKRCITANYANLSWQDHQDRINDWKDRRQGVVVAGYSYGTILGLTYVFTRNELWAIWAVLGLLLGFVVLCYIAFVLQLHVRHQAKKTPSGPAIAR